MVNGQTAVPRITKTKILNAGGTRGLRGISANGLDDIRLQQMEKAPNKRAHLRSFLTRLQQKK